VADNQSVPMPPHIKAELARLRALMVPDAEAYRRREIGSKRMEEEAKKIQPLRPLGAADTDLEYLSAAKGGAIHMEKGGRPPSGREMYMPKELTTLEKTSRFVDDNVTPFVNRGIDAMFPMREMARIALLSKTQAPIQKLRQQNPHAFDYAMDQASNGNMYPLPKQDEMIPVGRANGGQVDMDRMRLELMNGGGKAKFLKDSKVKERLYHGTIADIDKFKMPKNSVGIWASRSPDVANEYATIAARGSGNPSIYPLHAHLKNPASEKEFGDAWEEAAKDSSRLGWNTHDQRHREILQSKGFDGAILGDSVVVFNPKQLKSAIGNRGTYDINDPDITKAKGGSVKEPKNSVKAYKLFRVHPKHPGKLFPLFVNANEPVEMNKWVDAKEGEMAGDKVKSKIGPLAYRPGWHAGDLPVATHIGEKSDPSLTAPDVRPANHVWAEVEMPHDVDWQSVANERGMNPKGKLIARNAHITDQIPKGGHYRYKTNSNMTGNWLIGGAMKVNRVLQDKEVKAINKAAGAADLPRTRPFKAKDYGLAKGGVVAPEEFIAEEHVNHMAKGGSRIVSMKEIEDYIRQKRGEHASKRVQRAADEIPGLENMYTPEALQHTFERQNAGLMSMNPADFEKFAERMREDITRKDSKRKTRNDEVLPFDSYLNHLAQLKGGFDEVPFLELGHRDPEYLPSIEGHEGRHRSRALSGRGVKKSLVQLMPAARLSMSMPKRNSEKLVQKLNQTLGKDRFVSPEGGGLLPSDQTAGMYNWLREKKLLEANRPQLPEVYKSGGATHAHHLDIEERPL